VARHRRGDELYLTLARRWSKVMITLFAVGVVTGTVLSFEMGLLWPRFVGTFGPVFGLGFAIERFSVFLEIRARLSSALALSTITCTRCSGCGNHHPVGH
jgi:cytochrome bd-type quinol oxidase subunit 1